MNLIRVKIGRIRVEIDRIQIEIERIRIEIDRIQIDIDRIRIDIDRIRIEIVRIRVKIGRIWIQPDTLTVKYFELFYFIQICSINIPTLQTSESGSDFFLNRFGSNQIT